MKSSTHLLWFGIAAEASAGATTASGTVKFAVGPRRFFRVVAHLPLSP